MLSERHKDKPRQLETQGLPASGSVEFKKTPMMLEAGQFVGDLGEYLEVGYVFFQRSSQQIKDELRQLSNGKFNPSRDTIYSWLGKYGVSRRSQSEVVRLIWQTESRRGMVEGIKRAWSDPQLKSQRIAKIHSEEADKKRAQSLKSYYEQHPEVRKQKFEKVRERKKMKRMAEAEEVFGEFPAVTLRQWYIKQKLTIAEIARKIGKSDHKIKAWLKDCGINIRKGTKGARLIGSIKQGDKELFQEGMRKGLIGKFDKRERYILKARFLTNPPNTLQQIGQKFRVTRVRIGQIEAKAINKLQRLSRGEKVVVRKQTRQRQLLDDNPAVEVIKEPLPSYCVETPGFSFEFDRLGLSNKTRNALVRNFWNRKPTIKELYEIPDRELLQFRQIGMISLKELKDKLELFRKELLERQNKT